jgi:outer membrane protein OmpA-like peptidoglycan-associated protein
MRIEGLAITFCLGLGVTDLLTINLVLSPKLAGEPIGSPAALALPVRDSLVAPATAPASVPVPTPASVPVPTPAPAPAPAPVPAPVAAPDPAPIPEPAAVPVAQPLAIIYFEKSLSRLDTASKARLNTLAAELRRHPDWKIRISGHADPTGPDDLNQRLSKHRARVVAARLERAGIDEERIETIGRGAQDPCESAESCRRAQVAMRRGDE